MRCTTSDAARGLALVPMAASALSISSVTDLSSEALVNTNVGIEGVSGGVGVDRGVASPVNGARLGGGAAATWPTWGLLPNKPEPRIGVDCGRDSQLMLLFRH